MKNKSYSKNLSLLLASLTVIIVGFNVFWGAKVINIDTVLYCLKVAIPATVCMAFLGGIIGQILDTSDPRGIRHSKKFSDGSGDLLIDETLLDDIAGDG